MELTTMLNKEVSVPKFPADFETQLRFLTSEEDGRHGPVYQGYRPDFRYEGDVNELWMVRPVFINEDGTVIPGDVPIIGDVLAQMYIVVDEMRKTVHRQRLHLGSDNSTLINQRASIGFHESRVAPRPLV